MEGRSWGPRVSYILDYSKPKNSTVKKADGKKYENIESLPGFFQPVEDKYLVPC